MAKKRTYSAQSVEQVRIETIQSALAAGCIVALDVAKQKFVVALATLAGEVVRLFRFEHPLQTQLFLNVVMALKSVVEVGKLRAAMEPTGTYGDAVRHQLVELGIPVSMVAPKKTFDSKALFDDVSSLHDPKSAVLIAKLCSMGLATEWRPPPPTRPRLRALIELRAHELGIEERCFGRLEAILARHWPEFGCWMDLRSQKSALMLLAKCPGPARVKAEPEVQQFLRKASRARLSESSTKGIIESSMTTLGMPMSEEEELTITTLAQQALDAQVRARALEGAMTKLGSDDEVFKRLEAWMGTYTAAAMVALCDPRQYEKARQLEKACGLNLREKSSGNFVGRLSITKRGPSLTRKLLFMFALRMINNSSEVRAWYMRRRGYTETSKQRAVVAVMRKLVRAMFHVARGQTFDANKLFDVRRLDLTSHSAAKTKSPKAGRALSTTAEVAVH